MGPAKAAGPFTFRPPSADVLQSPSNGTIQDPIMIVEKLAAPITTPDRQRHALGGR
jgi:hypothetical protein